MDPALDLGDGGDRLADRDRPHRLRLDIVAAAVEPRQQVVHLPHRAVQGRDHVLAELGLVGVALGVADDEAELADQILDVVDDEGEAAVELVEPPGVGERVLGARFGEIARRLDPDGAEQVEILPVERPADQRMLEQDQPDQPIAVDQRDSGPKRVERGHRRHRAASSVWACAALRNPGKSTMWALRSRKAISAASSALLSGRSSRQFHRAATLRRPLFRHQQQSRRGFGDVGDRLDDPLAERRIAADGAGEAKPFLAIVVAMLEEMLGDDAPGTRPASAPRAEGSPPRR